jgi:hypothetical protein
MADRVPLWRSHNRWVVPLREHYRRYGVFEAVQLAAIVLVVYWSIHLPVPGYAIGVVAILAAAMTVQGEMLKCHKVVWMLLMGGFLLLEFRAINKDRDENQRHFEDVLNSVTGDDSFCYLDISPVRAANVVGNAASMTVVRVGKYPLRALTMTIYDQTRYSESFPTARNHIPKLGEMAAETMRAAQASTKAQPIPDFATSDRYIDTYHLSGGDRESFTVRFSAFNGSWTERLELRRVGGKWVKAMWVEALASPYYVKIDPDYPHGVNGEPDVPSWPRNSKTGRLPWEH